MAYEKPVVVTLSFASPAIRTVSDGSGDSTKGIHVSETFVDGSASDGTGTGSKDGVTATSSTQSAYEADE